MSDTGLDPTTVAAWLGHGLQPSLLRRLMATARFAPRVAELVEARMGDLPERLEPAQAAILELDRLAIIGLALRAGAVWHGNAIARMIDGVSVRRLVAAIGPDLRAVALLHREMSPPAELEELDDLASSLERAGFGCLRAWCARQPRPVALRVELRLPQGLAPSDEQLDAGPVITDVLLRRAG